MNVPLLREPMSWLGALWPRQTTEDQQLAGLLALHGLSRHGLCRLNAVLEVAGNSEAITHRVGLPNSRVEAATHQLRQALPGLVLDPAEPTRQHPARVARVWLSTRRRPLATERIQSVAHAVLAAIASAQTGEIVIVRWYLGPVRRSTAPPSQPGRDRAYRVRLLGLTGVATTDERTALGRKQALPGWRCVGRIAVLATTQGRQRQLIRRVAAAMRMAEGPGVQIGLYPASPTAFQRLTAPLRYPSALNLCELIALAAWPVGPTGALPVSRSLSRPTPAARSIPRAGRIVGISAFPGDERPLALNAPDALMHLHAAGSTGAGKSTVLLNLLAADIAAGSSVVIVEPKRDLIDAALARIPESRRDHVVVISPADDVTVGVNPLAVHGRPPELVVDGILAVFRGLYGNAWGPRMQDILHASLLTLVRAPGATLPDLVPLLTDGAFALPRIKAVQDDLALASFWDSFAAMSEQTRGAALAPVMTRLRALIMRPRMRAVIGQAQPRFDLHQVFKRPTILLVDLSRGLLGPAAANLLGGLIVGSLVEGIFDRASIPHDRRFPVYCYFDEFAEYTHLDVDLESALAQARSHGVSLTLAHQSLSQLDASMRAAVLTNARSRIVFRTSHEDATVLVRGQGAITADDVTSLPAHQAYVQLVAQNTVTPYALVRTLPAGPSCSDPEELRALSRERYGTPAAAVEAALARRVNRTAAFDAPLGRRLRDPDPDEDEEGQR